MTDSAPLAPAPPSADERDALDFVPLPCRSRNGWTAARQRGFIAGLCELGLVGQAAAAVGMSRQSAYRLRARAESGVEAGAGAGAEAEAGSFAAAWDAAIDQGQCEALSLALDRAVGGVAEPYFYGGRQRGERRRFDTGLLLATLRAAEVRAGRQHVEPDGPSDPRKDTGERLGGSRENGALRKLRRSSITDNGSTEFAGDGL